MSRPNSNGATMPLDSRKAHTTIPRTTKNRSNISNPDAVGRSLSRIMFRLLMS